MATLTKNEQMLVLHAFELGYKYHELGMNLELGKIEIMKMLEK